MIGKSFHLLQLVRIIPPEDVELDDVRDKLRQDVRDRIVELRKPMILNQLFRQAIEDGRIVFVNPILRQQHEQARKQSGPSTEVQTQSE